MASIIQIKRSGTSTSPSSLKIGELAYSYADSSRKLFIGVGDFDSYGTADSVSVIGGEFYTNLLSSDKGIAGAGSFLLLGDDRDVDYLRISALISDSAIIEKLTVDSAEIIHISAESIDVTYLNADSADFVILRSEEGVIKQFSADSTYTSYLKADSAYIDQLSVDSAFIQTLKVNTLKASYIEADSAFISQLGVDSAYITYGKLDSADIHSLRSDSAYISQLTTDSANIQYLKADSAFISQLSVDSGYIQYLSADSAFISQLSGDSAYIQYLKSDSADISELSVDHAGIQKLDVDSATISTLSSTQATVGTLHTGMITGPERIIIDPSAIGDATGELVVLGNLTVQGEQTVINSTTVTINDKNIVLADSAEDSSWADGAGLTIAGANATFTYKYIGDKFVVNKNLEAPGLYADYADIKNLDVDSGYSDRFYIGGLVSDSGRFNDLTTKKFTLDGLPTNSIIFTDADGTFLGDSELGFDSQQFTVGIDKFSVQRSTGNVIGADAVFDNLEIKSFVKTGVVYVGTDDKLKSSEEFFYGTHTSSNYGNTSGLNVSFEPVFDDGYYNITLANDGSIHSKGFKSGEYRLRPTGQYSPVYPDSGNLDFYGLQVSDRNFYSTTQYNEFKSELTQAEGAGLSFTSDSSNLIKVVDINDSALFEVKKDGSINFTGELYKAGAKFNGGGIFVKKANDDAYIIKDPALQNYTETGVNNAFGYGRIGIQTDTPKYGLEINNENFQVGGDFDANKINYSLVALNGFEDYVDDSDKSRFSFISSRAMVRGGYFLGTDYANLGNAGLYSTAFGQETLAKGEASFAAGSRSKAIGSYSVAIGQENTTGNENNIGGVVIGRYNLLSEDGSTDDGIAIGNDNLVRGDEAVAIGASNEILGNFSTVLGRNNKILGQEQTTSQGAGILGNDNAINAGGSFVIGTASTVNGNAALSLGNSNFVGGNNAIALGTNARANAQSSIAIGTNVQIDSSAEFSVSIGLGAGTKGIVTDQNLLVVQGGNVSIGAESDYFDDLNGNLYVAGNILVSGDILRASPDGSTINSTVFVDDGQYVTYALGRKIAVNKSTAYQNLDILGSFINEGTIGSEPDSGWFDSTTENTSMFSYLPAGGILRAGQFNPGAVAGYHSIALGRENVASGISATAIGRDNNVSGVNSFALGRNNVIEQDNTFFVGTNNTQDSLNIGSPNFIFGHDNSYLGTSVNNYIIGNNVEVPAGTSNTIFLNAGVQTGADNTKIAIGKNFADYALDINGSMRLDSGTIYIGNQTIREYLGIGASETDIVIGEQYTGEIPTIDISRASPAPVRVTTADAHTLSENAAILIDSVQGLFGINNELFYVGVIDSFIFDMFKDSEGIIPVIGGTDITGTRVGTDATFFKVIPPQPIDPSLTVAGDLIVKAGGTNLLVDSTGISFDGMSFDSYVTRPNGGLLPQLEDFLDTDYVQARVSLAEFWQVSEDALYYDPETPRPIGIKTSTPSAAYALDVNGAINTQVDISSPGGSPYTNNDAPWPTQSYLSTIITPDYINSRVSLDAEELAGLIDEDYVRSIVDSSYILSAANDSSEWQRRDDTLFFGTYPNVQNVQVGIGTDNVENGVKFQVAGYGKFDSGLTVGGALLVSGTEVTTDSEYNYTFTSDDLQTTENSQSLDNAGIKSALANNNDSSFTIFFSEDIAQKYFTAYRVDSAGDSSSLILDQDFAFIGTSAVNVYETSVDSTDLELSLVEKIIEGGFLTFTEGPLDYNTDHSQVIILDSAGNKKRTLLETDYTFVNSNEVRVFDSTYLSLNDQITILDRSPKIVSSTELVGPVTVQGETEFNNSVTFNTSPEFKDGLLATAGTFQFNTDIHIDSGSTLYHGPGGLSFDSNIARIVDSDYIGERLTTPWNITNGGKTIYYDAGGVVVIGSPEDIIDSATRFFVDSGNAIFRQSTWDGDNEITPGVVPEYGAGPRMMWIPQRGAFRAGVVDGTQVTWDDDEVGLASVGIGYNARASNYSLALGYAARAGETGGRDRAIAIGYDIYNPSTDGVAIGSGIQHSISRSDNVSIGKGITNNAASGTVAIGSDVRTGGGTSIVIGQNSVSGRGGTSIGESVNTGTNATSIGKDNNVGTSGTSVGKLANASNGGVSVGSSVSSGRSGTAIGRSSSSSTSGVAIGSNISTGNGGVAIGANSTGGRSSVVIGRSNSAGRSAVLIGLGNHGVNNAVGIGLNNTGNNFSSINVGHNNSSNTRNSINMGRSNTGNSYNSINLGEGNSSNTGRRGRTFLAGYNNTSNSAVFAYGKNNTGNYKAYIYGNDNTGSDEGYGYIYGSDNRIIRGGFAVGQNSTVTDGGFSFGAGSTVSLSGLSYGSNNTVSNGGFGFGGSNIVNGATGAAYAFGEGNTATAYGLAFGRNNTVSNYGISIGEGTNNSGYKSIAIGTGLEVTGSYSVGISLSASPSQVIADDNILAIVGGKAVTIFTSDYDSDLYIGTGPHVNIGGSINVNEDGDYYRQGKRLYDYITQDVVNEDYIRFHADSDYVHTAVDVAYLREKLIPQYFFHSDANTNDLYYNGNNNVGIKTDDPRYDLHVGGDINFDGRLFLNGDLVVPSTDSIGDVYIEHHTNIYNIDAESAENYFDSNYVQDRQAFFDYENTIDISYINERIDGTQFLDSGEALGMIGVALEDVAFKLDPLGFTSYNNGVNPALGSRMGIGMSADFNKALSINGDVQIGKGPNPGGAQTGSLNIWTTGANDPGIFINGDAFDPNIVFVEGTTYTTYGLSKNIAIKKTTAVYDFDVGGTINADEGIYLDGIELRDIFDSDFVQSRQVRVDSDAIAGFVDSDYVQDRVGNDYIKSIVDSGYIKYVANESYVKSIADSDYIKFVADSDYIKLVANEEYVKSLADSDWVKSIADSDYIKFVADETYIKSVADSDYIKLVANEGYIKSIADSDYIKFVADEKYIQSAADSDWIKLVANEEYIQSIADSDYISSVTGIGVRDVNFGSHKITYSNSYGIINDLPNPALYEGMTAVLRSTNKSYIAINGAWVPSAVENTDVNFNSVSITDGLTVNGNLQVNGTTTTVNSETLEISDNMIYLNAGESAGSPIADIDIGFAANYNDDGTYAHTGFIRDATDGVWKLFDGYSPEPDNSVEINTGHASFNLATLQVDRIITNAIDKNSSIEAGSYGSASLIPVIFMDSHGSIDSIGSVAVAGVASVSYDSGSAEFTIFTADGNSFSDTINLAPFNTNDLSEGDSNLYYSENRVISLIDSAYIQNRAPSGVDSSAITDLIDSAYINDRAGISGTSNFLANRIQYQSYYYTPDANQTTISGVDDNGKTLAYNLGTVQVFINGVATLDYTATNGTSIELQTGAAGTEDIVISALTITGEVGFGFKEFTFISDAGQDEFTGSDEENQELSYTPGNIIVYFNGIKLISGSDYTATDGNKITLTLAAEVGDEITVTTTHLENSLLDSGLNQFADIQVNALTNVTGTYINTVNGITADSSGIVILDEVKHNSSFTSMEYLVHMQDSDNEQTQITKMLVTYNKSDAFSTEYGILNSYGNDSDMGTLSVDATGTLIRLKFQKSAGTGNITVKPVKTIIQ